MTSMVNARGLACPQPVILARKALQEGSPITVIVDNETAQRNVAGMAVKMGWQVQVEPRQDGIYLHIAPPVEPVETRSVETCSVQAGPIVVVVASDTMGHGEHAELGQILVRAFFHTLSEVSPLPDTVIFLNSGVKLTVEGSPVLDDLLALREQGIQILACGTCLGYYNLKEQLKVGEVSNMYTIAETMLNAGRLIHL